jgi:hypothetical protein
MPIPWLRLIDAAIGLTGVVRQVSGRTGTGLSRGDRMALVDRTDRAVETRLANVVVAALKEAFHRDHRRLEIEREQIEYERRRAERALRLERQRQAGDREVGRLRLVAGAAVTGWLGALLVAMMLADGGAAARAALGLGWLLLLGSVMAALAGQSQVARALEPSADGPDANGGVNAASSGVAGRAAPWLLVGGMAMVALAVLAA